jgi:hypothetical protein
LFLFTDVVEPEAPTRVLVGSHLDIARVTGASGDVYLCHPFAVHAAPWPHRCDRPRTMAQPRVFPKEPYALTDAADAPTVERAVLGGLGP